MPLENRFQQFDKIQKAPPENALQQSSKIMEYIRLAVLFLMGVVAGANNAGCEFDTTGLSMPDGYSVVDGAKDADSKKDGATDSKVDASDADSDAGLEDASSDAAVADASQDAGQTDDAGLDAQAQTDAAEDAASDGQVEDSTVPLDTGPTIEINCSDGLDNDGDGSIDCWDSDCSLSSPVCWGEVCGTSTDDDNDGAPMCQDSECIELSKCINWKINTCSTPGMSCTNPGVSPIYCQVGVCSQVDQNGDSWCMPENSNCF
jgi:hypothetical protein